MAAIWEDYVFYNGNHLLEIELTYADHRTNEHELQCR